MGNADYFDLKVTVTNVAEAVPATVPLAIRGYYPLYLTATEASQQGGDGTGADGVHTHQLWDLHDQTSSRRTYYMPNNPRSTIYNPDGATFHGTFNYLFKNNNADLSSDATFSWQENETGESGPIFTMVDILEDGLSAFAIQDTTNPSFAGGQTVLGSWKLEGPDAAHLILMTDDFTGTHPDKLYVQLRWTETNNLNAGNFGFAPDYESPTDGDQSPVYPQQRISDNSTTWTPSYSYSELFPGGGISSSTDNNYDNVISFKLSSEIPFNTTQGQYVVKEGSIFHKVVRVQVGDETLEAGSDPMIININLDLPAGISQNVTNNEYGFIVQHDDAITIDWGDGTIQNYNGSTWHQSHIHTYSSSGTKQVKIYGPLKSYGNNGGNSYTYNPKITSISSWGNLPLEDLDYALYYAYNVSSVPNHLPSTVTSIRSIFERAKRFNGSGPDTWNTENITNMQATFKFAELYDGYLGNWDVSNVTTMRDMFAFARAFQGGGVAKWNVGNVTTMERMFEQADEFGNQSNLIAGNSSNPGDINNWDTSKVTDMSYMFRSTKFNEFIGDWDVKAVTTMRSMFEGATQFNQNLSGWMVDRRFEGSLMNVMQMFYNATSFRGGSGYSIFSLKPTGSLYETFRNSGIDLLKLGKPTSSSGALSKWDVSEITIFNNCFYDAGDFTGEGLGDWDVSSATSMSSMFYNCTSLVDCYWDATGTTLNSWGDKTQNVTTMSQMFYNCEQFTCDLSSWDVSAVTSFHQMFYGCDELVECGCGNWKIGDNIVNNLAATNLSMTTMALSSMFMNCAKFEGDPKMGVAHPHRASWLPSINTNNEITGNVNTQMMFWGTKFNQDISEWDTSNVTSGFNHMFYDNGEFSQDLSSWNTSNVTKLNMMFAGGSTQAKVNFDMSNWNISNLESAGSFLRRNDTLSSANYTSTLIGWAAQSHQGGIPQDITIDFGYATYNSGGVASRNKLINDYNWTITDGGPA